MLNINLKALKKNFKIFLMILLKRISKTFKNTTLRKIINKIFNKDAIKRMIISLTFGFSIRYILILFKWKILIKSDFGFAIFLLISFWSLRITHTIIDFYFPKESYLFSRLEKKLNRISMEIFLEKLPNKNIQKTLNKYLDILRDSTIIELYNAENKKKFMVFSNSRIKLFKEEDIIYDNFKLNNLSCIFRIFNIKLKESIICDNAILFYFQLEGDKLLLEITEQLKFELNKFYFFKCLTEGKFFAKRFKVKHLPLDMQEKLFFLYSLAYVNLSKNQNVKSLIDYFDLHIPHIKNVIKYQENLYLIRKYNILTKSEQRKLNSVYSECEIENIKRIIDKNSCLFKEQVELIIKEIIENYKENLKKLPENLKNL